MPHISQKYGQFQYFDIQLGHPVWRGKYVIDFGGNAGNILKDPASTIDIEVSLHRHRARSDREGPPRIP